MSSPASASVAGRVRRPSAAGAPRLLITIDTEGDDLWARPRVVRTENTRYLWRFQELAEEFGFKPTYLTDYVMARDAEFVRLGREALARGTAEIGMHLHAWDTPPLEPLTADDQAACTYLIEYPDRVMRAKIREMTARLEDTFGLKMVSHRAGRWAFDARYARMLVEEGYGVDCSVTPGVSWESSAGGVGGGSDYTGFPDRAYWLDLDDISRPGESPLLEVPVTILSFTPPVLRPVDRALVDVQGLAGALVRPLRAPLRRAFPPAAWLRPDGRNGRRMLRILDRVLAEGRDYAQFMLHSSEFMPGGSPTFPTEASIERLYADLRTLFAAARGRFVGATMAEYHRDVTAT